MQTTTDAPVSDARRISSLDRLRVARLSLADAAVAQACLALVALHVVDDSVSCSRSRACRRADHLASGLVPVALVAGAAVGVRPAAAGRAGGAGTGRSAMFGIACWSRGGLLHAERRPFGRRLQQGGCRSPPASLLVGIGIVTLWRTRRTDDSRRRRYAEANAARDRRSARRVPGHVPRRDRAGRDATRHVRTCPTPNLGGAHEDVAFTTSDGLRLEGLVRAFAERCDGDRVSRSLRARRSRHACSCGTATACCSSTVAARERATATRTSFGWGGDRDLHAAAAYLRIPRRRRPGADRRDRPLRRRRDADPCGRPFGCASARSSPKERAASRCATNWANPGLSDRASGAPDAGEPHGRAHALFTNELCRRRA